MNAVSITLVGGDALVAALASAPEIVDDEINRFMHGAVADLSREVIDRTPASYGVLRASIGGTVDRLSDGLLGVVGTAQPYAEAVELGTKPHRPPVQPLADWVAQRLGVRGAAARHIAFAIANKIARVGTKGAFMFRDAFQANEAEVQRQFGLTMDRIVQRLGAA